MAHSDSPDRRTAEADHADPAHTETEVLSSPPERAGLLSRASRLLRPAGPPGPPPLPPAEPIPDELPPELTRNSTDKNGTTARPRRPGRRTGRAGKDQAGQPGHEDVAGLALARLTSLPPLLLIAWLVPGLPLLLTGNFVPVPMLLISGPLLVALVVNGLRVVPGRWPRLIPGNAPDRNWTSWFGLMATVAVAAGFAAWQLVEHSESVAVLRDQGAYLQTGYWLAQHGTLPIPQSLHAFGGPHPGLGFSSIGFFAHGTSVVPSFMTGLPMLLAGGFWAHGVPGAAAIGPVLGGLAVLSFGGLTARLAGPLWAPAGAIVLGLALPEQYASRTSLAEPAVQVLLFGGLCLLTDVLTVRGEQPPAPWPQPDGRRRLLRARAPAQWRTPQAVMAGLAGLALGMGVLLSLNSLVYLLPVIPFAGLLIAARRPAAVPFCCGVLLGAAYGFADGYVLSRPFLDAQAHLMELIGIIAVWLAALTIATVQLLRVPRARARLRRIAGKRPARWLPAAGGLLAVAALIGFAVRPYVQTARNDAPGLAVYHYIAGLQRAQGLPLDPTRSYADQTLYWVIWYIGLPTVLLGAFGLGLLAHHCLRALVTWKDRPGAWRNWALPLAIICAGSAAVLWQPEIVPDQPWASRRLVVIVLPGLIICALWASRWLTGHARARGARPVTASVAGLFCVAALVVPTAATTFGAGLTHTGRSGGLRASAHGMAFKQTGAGELTAVEQLCSSIRQKSSVVIVDRFIAQRFTQAIRGMCGVPAAWMVGQQPGAVGTALSAITAAGRHPVLLGSGPAQLSQFGGTPVKIVDLRTTTDPRQLTRPPTTPSAARFVIWMTAPQPGASGL
ncbi:MAG TPA: hypothetical protein VFV41_18730 [Streptosporangiaceae bacterium]|nr:hypothetical protein [Streptosporangiaceae bacterium]